MPAKRLLCLVGAALLLAFLVPLAAAAVGAALETCCPDCPPPAPLGDASDGAPCHGDPLLVCCDEQAMPARAPHAEKLRSGLLHPHAAASAAQPLPFAAALGADAAARDPVWWTSPQRLSVVLRL